MMHTRVPLPHVEARACRDLWSAVLLSVVRDLCNPGDRSRERSEAERWVGDWPGRDFRTVCHLTGIEPNWLHGALLQLMALPVAERRHALATRLGCQPGQIGVCLMVRQQSLENPESEASDTGQRAQKGGPAPISAGARKARVEAMFVQGLPPSDMPRMLAANGNAVSMGMVFHNGSPVVKRATSAAMRYRIAGMALSTMPSWAFLVLSDCFDRPAAMMAHLPYSHQVLASILGLLLYELERPPSWSADLANALRQTEGDSS